MVDPRSPASLSALAYGGLVDVVAPLSARECARPTRASGWCVADLVFHLLLDAQRALITLASPTSAACDRDAIDDWRDFPPGRAGAGEHADFVRRSVEAYRSPEALLRLFCTTASAAGRLARSCDPVVRVQTQGHVLTVADFLSTLVVEATVHHLDLVVELPHAQPAGGPPWNTASTL